MQLYVGNLAPQVDEPLLFELMSQLAPVAAVRMPRNKATREHQGYGFATLDPSDAEYVLGLSTAQSIKLYGRPIRVKTAAKSGTPGPESAKTEEPKNPSAEPIEQKAQPPKAQSQKAYVRRLFVGNLAAVASDSSLRVPFEKFGEVRKIEFGPSTGETTHAFVEMGSMAEAKAALALNSQRVLDRVIRVEFEK